MAASSQAGGHQCEFVEQVSEEFKCKKCSLVARDLSITVCCGEYYCQVCISPFQEGSKPCPGCGQEGFTVVPHMRHRKSILALEVCCSMKDRGCEWTGVLQDLDAHLDVDTGDCQFVDVQCPNKCSQPVQKREVPDHLENSCHKRDYNCRYCGFTGSYEVVCNEHYPQCDSYPIPCPNSCTVVSIERGTLDMHLKMCPYQEVECEVMGCGERFTREELDTHMERSTQKHIALMAVATQRMSREFKEKLRQESERIEREAERKFQEKNEQIAELEKQLHQKEQQMAEAVQKVSQEFQNKIQEMEKKRLQKEEELEQRLKMFLTVPPVILQNFSQHKAQNSSWTSPPFFTHPGGYKLCLRVWPNGEPGYTAHNSAVTVRLCSMKGEYDETLQWPATFSITVQLLNQHRDQDHYTQSQEIKWNKQAREVTERGWISSLNSIFIRHTDLQWKPDKQTQYLKNDCLLFKFTYK